MERVGRERKVRFTLPDTKAAVNPGINQHSTFTYLNGTLLNIAGRQIARRASTVLVTPTPITIQLPTVKTIDSIPLKPQVTFRDSVLRTAIKTAPANPSRIEHLKKRHIVIITDQPKTIRPVKTPDTSTICNRFSRLMLVDDVLASKPPPIIIPLEAPRPLVTQTVLNRQLKGATTVRRIAKSLFSADTNSALVADLIDRWHRMRYREKLQSRQKLLSEIESNRQVQPLPTTTVSIRNRVRSDVRFGSFKMSLEREPNVTTLLRAAREADENLLKAVLRKILIDGISKEALNSSDKSGRTAISYICSTNLTNFLDILLQIPGIDVNKPDNEGNTPLHFAAQAGQSDTLNMLITRSRSLQIDAKNCLGFTPLMKAALQGRTRCAKLLLFAGASPVETDFGRGLRAEQWAAFCGRLSCSEMIEKCARARLLDKSQSCRTGDPLPKMTVHRSKTTTIHTQIGETFRTKFRKFLPFGTTVKDRQNQNPKDFRGLSNNRSDIVDYLKSATICASGPALPSQGKSQILTTLLRPLEVPKLEVTPANNQQLIKKYEAKLNRDQTDIPMVATSPTIRY